MKTFKTFGGAAAHLERLALGGHEVTQHIAERTGEIVEARAKDMIGHYQPGSGQFVQWAQLAESTEAQKAAKGYPQNAPLEATGEMRDSISHRVEAGLLGAKIVVGTNDEKMAYHEFGTEKMPPRPVLGPAMFGSLKQAGVLAVEVWVSYLVGRNWRTKK